MYEVELEEGHVDQWIVVMKQRIDSIIDHLVIFHVFFEESTGNTLLELLLESLIRLDILEFNEPYYFICLNLR